MLKRLQQQAAARQQHDGERRLDDDERMLEPMAARAGAAAAAVAQSVLQVRAASRGAPAPVRTSRPAATAIAAENASTRQSSVSRTAAIVSGTSVSRNRITGMASASPASAPQPGEHQALDQELRDQSTASGAERRAHRHFAAAQRAARQQQIRQVDARDQQHRRRRRRAARSATCASCPPALRAAASPPPRAVSARAAPTRAGSTPPSLPLACCERDAGLQPGHAVHVVPAQNFVSISGRERGRHPDVDVARRHEVELARHHADHLVRRVVQRDRAAHHVGRRAEAPLPQPMADDDDARALRVFVFGEDPSEQRLHAKDGPEIRR